MPVAQGLTPKQSVPDDVRTDGKDEAFEALEALREQGRFHGRPMTDLEEEIGWSRQHIANVLRDYYSETGGRGGASSAVEPGGEGLHVRFDIEIPEDIEEAGQTGAFLRGYVQGYMAREK